jgi:peroxiredoxin
LAKSELIEEGSAMLRTLALFFLLSGATVARAEKPAPPENVAADFAIISRAALASSDGVARTPLAEHGQKATVLIFLTHDCPVTNATAPELARLTGEFTPRGVHFFGIYTTETAAEINTHRRDYGLDFPGLLDPKHQLARLTGATRVPEAAVFSPAGKLLYRGRIDDRAVQTGLTRPTPSRHDLRLALEAVLAGKPPEPRFTTSVGCYLQTN